MGSGEKSSVLRNLFGFTNCRNRVCQERTLHLRYWVSTFAFTDWVAAHSTELVDDAKEPVVIFMPEGSRTHLGGTMRLGLRPTLFQPGSEKSTIRKLYGGSTEVHERHRHRYEINPDYIQRLEDGGLRFIGRDDKGERMEIFELPTEATAGPTHPYYVGVQYHPELKR
jgi:CTP synthase